MSCLIDEKCIRLGSVIGRYLCRMKTDVFIVHSTHDLITGPWRSPCLIVNHGFILDVIWMGSTNSWYRTYSNQSTDDVDNVKCSMMYQMEFSISMGIFYPVFFLFAWEELMSWQWNYSRLIATVLTRNHLWRGRKKEPTMESITALFIQSVAVQFADGQITAPNSLNKEISKQTNTPAWTGLKKKKKKNEKKFDENFKFSHFHRIRIVE